MNTKLTFYCTHINYGVFEKLIFDTVLTDTFYNIYDAKEWLDCQVPNIYNDFDLNLVFDWVIIDYKETNEDVKPVEIINEIEGVLTFETKVKKPKKIKKTKIEEPKIEEPKIEEPKKYTSVWIDPYGKTYEVAFAEHNEFASKWLKENDEKTYKDVDHFTYYYEILQNKGWARILGWTKTPTFVLPIKIGPKLKASIREYCLANKLDYKDFPEILKS